MTQKERLEWLNKHLLEEMPEYKEKAKMFGQDENEQFLLFRSLVNVRDALPTDLKFLKMQDDFLKAEIQKKGITDISNLKEIQKDIYLWQGDITTLNCDAIVNAANSGMVGCFCPCHSCIDNAIHTFAGVELRLACAKIMEEQGTEEPTGSAKITPSFNLPCRYVIHTVGPIVAKSPTKKDTDLLASCYLSCLKLAERNNIKSIAFCCISTGEFHFPNQMAAEIAIKTVKDYRLTTNSRIKVIFNVFKEIDYKIYRELLR